MMAKLTTFVSQPYISARPSIAKIEVRPHQKRDVDQDMRRYGALSIPGTIAVVIAGTRIACVFRPRICMSPNAKAKAREAAAAAAKALEAPTPGVATPARLSGTFKEIEEERLVAPSSRARSRSASVIPSPSVPSSPASFYTAAPSSGFGSPVSWSSSNRATPRHSISEPFYPLSNTS